MTVVGSSPAAAENKMSSAMAGSDDVAASCCSVFNFWENVAVLQQHLTEASVVVQWHGFVQQLT